MITPLSDRIIVKRIEPETKTASGLLIAHAEKRDEGTVLAAGPGRKTPNGIVTPMLVKVGDRVIFGPHVGTLIRTEEGDCLAMREDDLIAICD